MHTAVGGIMISNRSDFPEDKMLKKSERIYSQLISDQKKEMQSTFFDKLSFTKPCRSYSPKPFKLLILNKCLTEIRRLLKSVPFYL